MKYVKEVVTHLYDGEWINPTKCKKKIFDVTIFIKRM